MAESIMVGCDLHDKSMLLKIAVDRGRPVTRPWGTSRATRQAMIRDLRQRTQQAGAPRIVFAYEACGFGFRLHDELAAAGIEAYVLAPSKLERSAHHRKRKTDERDAQLLLDKVRSFVLAGVALPAVWVPDLVTRDDRELVRQRLKTAEDAAAVQLQIHWLLKRNGIESAPGKSRTAVRRQWLEGLIRDGSLAGGATAALASLLRQLAWLQSEIERLDEQVQALSQTARYSGPLAALRTSGGVGVLTAMVYLTEMGTLSRFRNRRQVGAFLGLAPSSHESGQQDDRKGHITHQGPSRVRKVLCQAVWCRLRHVEAERLAYQRVVQRNPQHKKIAVVARMRTLAVRLWHVGLAAQVAEATAVTD